MSDLSNQEVLSYELRKSLISKPIKMQSKLSFLIKLGSIRNKRQAQVKFTGYPKEFLKKQIPETMPALGTSSSKFRNADELIEAIKEYIEYYNHDQIQKKLKSPSPKISRNQALKSA